MSVEEGMNLTFICYTNNTSEIIWKFVNNILPPNAYAYRNKLYLQEVTRHNKGYYECQNEFGEHYWSGKPMLYFARALLKVVCK